MIKVALYCIHFNCLFLELVNCCMGVRVLLHLARLQNDDSRVLVVLFLLLLLRIQAFKLHLQQWKQS